VRASGESGDENSHKGREGSGNGFLSLANFSPKNTRLSYKLIFSEKRETERNKTKLQAASLNSLIRGAFHSTRSSEIFETEKNGTEISWKRFQKIRECLNFRKAKHSTKNDGNYRMKIKWNGNFQENV